MLYFNIFSSDPIFKPVNTNEKEVKKYEYAPFQALANYIKEQGYAGMIYKSTVHKNGTTLVLFDTDYASVALERAYNRQLPPLGSVLHHSDRGSQYCSKDYQKN